MGHNHHVHIAADDLSRERDDALKQDITSRLRSAAGHINGIARMVEDDKYCIDVINQIGAVQAALGRVSLLLLDDHMRHCVTDAIRSGDPAEAERVIAELDAVFEALSKRK
jgi:DNA-binding FrmR family transcriptional regulator